MQQDCAFEYNGESLSSGPIEQQHHCMRGWRGGSIASATDTGSHGTKLKKNQKKYRRNISRKQYHTPKMSRIVEQSSSWPTLAMTLVQGVMKGVLICISLTVSSLEYFKNIF